MARINPYTALKRSAREWAFSVVHPRRVQMFYYENAGVGSMRVLYERTAAAQQLGYNVRLYVKDDDGHLYVEYRKDHPDVPWEFRP